MARDQEFDRWSVKYWSRPIFATNGIVASNSDGNKSNGKYYFYKHVDTVRHRWSFTHLFIGPESDHLLPLSLLNSLTHYRQVPTQPLLLGGCQHPVSTPSVDTYLNDIRFGRCQHWVSTPTKGDTALEGVDTYQRRYCLARCQHLARQYLLW